ncbi:hypothetical protein L3X38_018259 [Prunus dulcis]|uniref:Aminotransferase-like plant mobile domain-containing protein n=1 Tax=Prunus dulcis TaxID=3755 RepID=A0AAD4WBF3_PRUDU|nr:hypothetical protein L3X38_018259 [Prunus dulcis]
MEVNNNANGDIEVGRKNNFPPILCKMLKNKTDWGLELSIRGLAEFRPGILEWTEAILRDFKEVLFRVEMYGVVAVSRYPYMYSLNVWKAFLELWGPLTNTLNQENGEMGISLYDLKIIGALPILGVPYEEFIPLNRDFYREVMSWYFFSLFSGSYISGWMGEYFPCLYRCHNDIEFPASYPHLTRYAGIAANDMDISKARVIFRSDISMRYRPSAFDEQDGLTFMDN